MALLLRDHDFLFIHAPRTGGTWVQAALNNIGLKPEPIGLKHCHISCGGDPFNIVRDGNIYTMTVVRHPISWYISNWSYGLTIGKRAWKDGRGWKPFEPDAMWHPTWDIDVHCGSPHFNEFIELCMELYPGFLSHLFNEYTRVPPDREASMIAKTETLEDDLAKALTEAGIDFDEEKMRETPRTNESFPHHRKYAKLLRDQVLRLIDAERPMMIKYGYSTDIEDNEQYIGWAY